MSNSLIFALVCAIAAIVAAAAQELSPAGAAIAAGAATPSLVKYLPGYWLK